MFKKIIIITLFLFYCSNPVRDNLNDPNSITYIPQISNVDVNRNMVTVYSEFGRSLWSKYFDSEIVEYIIIDLDQDYRYEVILGFGTGNFDSGYIYVFNWKGEKILSIDPPRSNPYSDFSSVARFSVEDFIVDNFGTNENKIVVSWSEEDYHKSKVTLFDNDLQEIWSYWNPGYINELILQDIDSDGIKEIIFTGWNNDLFKIRELSSSENPFKFVAVVKANSSGGQAPPYFIYDMPDGDHLWYLISFPQGIGFSLDIFDYFPEYNGLELRIQNSKTGKSWYLKNSCSFLQFVGDILEGEDALIRIEDKNHVYEICTTGQEIPIEQIKWY